MSSDDMQNRSENDTSCGSLLQELQHIWDEVGESDSERDKMLLQLEQECLDVYRRKVDQASRSRARLVQDLADYRVELSNLLSALGEPSHDLTEKGAGTLKEQLAIIRPVLEKLWKQKEERVEQFTDVQRQIQKICSEIAGNLQLGESPTPKVNEGDLSLKKLDQFHLQLKELQREKAERLQKIVEYVNVVRDLCAVLGVDFFSIITEVNPSLDDSVGIQSKSISNETLNKLAKMVQSLKDEKQQRLHKLQELGASLMDLWDLMDTSMDERHLFDHVTCYISAAVDEVTVPGALAIDIIEQVELEVERLDQLKASKMKELVFKKQLELEEIYRCAHMEIDSESAKQKLVALIDSGNIEPSELLAHMEDRIFKAKEEALSRKEIMEKVEKWLSSCEEESWLEDYMKDDNRYNASRGAHLNLKRAERARILVTKIPGLVENLIAKTKAWETDRKTAFLFDGVSLLAMLDEYTVLRQQREELKRRQKDQKRFNDQMGADQESAYGVRPSPSKGHSIKKVSAPRTSAAAANGPVINRRLSVSGQSGSNGITPGKQSKDSRRPAAPSNYVAIHKEETVSDTLSGTSSL